MSNNFIGKWQKVEANHHLYISKRGSTFYVNIDGNDNAAVIISDNELQSGSKYGNHKWILNGSDVIVEYNGGRKMHFDKV